MKHDSIIPAWAESRSCDLEGGDADSNGVLLSNGTYSHKLQDNEPVIVTWEGPLDPENPMNWSWRQKWITTILVSCFTFISPFSSTMVTPALDDISRDLNVPNGFMQQLVMSIFLLGYAQGPFVLAPLSEIFGRAIVLQSANLMYLVFNLACGFAQTKQQLLAFRFLSGVGGSAPQAVSHTKA